MEVTTHDDEDEDEDDDDDDDDDDGDDDEYDNFYGALKQHMPLQWCLDKNDVTCQRYALSK